MPTMTIAINTFLSDEEATFAYAAKLAAVVGDTAVIFLYGQLGAGKTTFSRGFLHYLGYQGTVKSPTYTLVEPYDLGTQQVFHFDFYRLHDPHELEYIGIRDYFVPQAICLIEWPEHGVGMLPIPDLSCYIELNGEGRTIKLEPVSARGAEILQRFKQTNS